MCVFYYLSAGSAALEVNSLNDLISALERQNITEITLSSQIEISVATVLDATGKTVKMTEATTSGALFNVTGGTLTIKGGNFIADIEHTSVNTNPATSGISVAAVYVRDGATLNIEDGYFYTGPDNMSTPAGVPVIEAWSGATVNIKGGKFEAAKPCSNGNGQYTWMVLNRCGTETEGIFNVTGGEFLNYNPAATLTDAGNNQEKATVVSGYHADSYKKDGTFVKCGATGKYGSNEDIWYVVKKDETNKHTN